MAYQVCPHCGEKVYYIDTYVGDDPQFLQKCLEGPITQADLTTYLYGYITCNSCRKEIKLNHANY